MSLGARDEALWIVSVHFQDWASPVVFVGFCSSPLPASEISRGGLPLCYFVTGQELI